MVCRRIAGRVKPFARRVNFAGRNALHRDIHLSAESAQAMLEPDHPRWRGRQRHDLGTGPRPVPLRSRRPPSDGTAAFRGQARATRSREHESARADPRRTARAAFEPTQPRAQIMMHCGRRITRRDATTPHCSCETLMKSFFFSIRLKLMVNDFLISRLAQVKKISSRFEQKTSSFREQFPAPRLRPIVG